MTFYHIPYDGAPMKCYECNVQDCLPKVKITGHFGARHVSCAEHLALRLNVELKEIPIPKQFA